jgi:hypothetical protein
MDNGLVEGFKFAGSVAGILSGAFLIYDRFVRDRPQAYLAKDGRDIDVVLKNAANETLIVDEIGVAPNVLGLAPGHEIKDIVPVIVRRGEDVAESKRRCFFPIEPLGELKFGVVRFDAFKQLKNDHRITVRLKWRNTRFVLSFARNVKVRTTAGDIRKLFGEDEEGCESDCDVLVLVAASSGQVAALAHAQPMIRTRLQKRKGCR